MWNRWVRGTEAGDSDPARRIAASRVPRLRLGRGGDRRPSRHPGAALPRQAGGARGDGARETPEGTLGIGHTRWATHGRPSEANAHPHKAGSVSVIHNGIIENYLSLRARLEAAGRKFASETDTEIVAHLVDEALLAGAPTLVEGLRRALRQVHGAYALVVISDKHPGELAAAKNASPLVLGLGKGETFLASDVPAILEHTREVIFLDEGDVVAVTAGKAVITDVEGKPRERQARTITWDAAQAEKGGYPHFMLKEIHEQPRAITDTLRGRLLLEDHDADLEGFEVDPRGLRRVLLLACGTSYHAGLVGKFLIEGTSRIPCEVDLASEFRYRDPVVGPEDLVIAISQSGETADTLAAVKEARARGARVLAISNVVDAAIPRASNGVLYTYAGPEIGVASTKCFTAQLAALRSSPFTSGGAAATSSPTRPPSWSRSWRSRRPR